MSSPDEILAICKCLYQINGKLDFAQTIKLGEAGMLVRFEIWKSGWDPLSNEEDDA